MVLFKQKELKLAGLKKLMMIITLLYISAKVALVRRKHRKRNIMTSIFEMQPWLKKIKEPSEFLEIFN